MNMKLKYDDAVDFKLDDIMIGYIVSRNCLTRGGRNFLIFDALKLNRTIFCTKAYGYTPISGEWPLSKPKDFKALTRCVTALAEIIAERGGQTLINGKVFTNDNIKKINLKQKMKDQLFLKSMSEPLPTDKIKEFGMEMAKSQLPVLKKEIEHFQLNITRNDNNRKRFEKDIKINRACMKKTKVDYEKKITKAKENLSTFSPERLLGRLLSLPIHNVLRENGRIGIITKTLKLDSIDSYSTNKYLEKGDLRRAKENQGREIGSFFIDLQFISDMTRIRIYNLDYISDNYNHPFIDEGELCSGNMGNKLDKACRDKNVINILDIIIELLVTPFGHNGFISWERWFKYLKKRPKEEIAQILKFKGESIEYSDDEESSFSRLSFPSLPPSAWRAITRRTDD